MGEVFLQLLLGVGVELVGLEFDWPGGLFFGLFDLELLLLDGLGFGLSGSCLTFFLFLFLFLLFGCFGLEDFGLLSPLFN